MVDMERLAGQLGAMGVALIGIIGGIIFELYHNPAQHESKFVKRRTTNWLCFGLARASQLMARYTFSTLNTQAGRLFLGITLRDFGWMIFVGIGTLPIGVLLFGMLVDRIGPKRTLLGALFVHGVLTLGFGLYMLMLAGEPMWISKRTATFIYFIVTCFLSTASEVTATKLNAVWFDRRERVSVTVEHNIMIGVGYTLGFAAASTVIDYWRPAGIFLFNAALMLVAIIMTLLFMHENLPSDEIEVEDEFAREVSATYGRVVPKRLPTYGLRGTMSAQETLANFSQIFKDYRFYIIAPALFGLGMIREGLLSYVYDFAESTYGVAGGSSNEELFIAMAISAGAIVSTLPAAFLCSFRNFTLGTALCLAIDSVLCFLGLGYVFALPLWVFIVCTGLVSLYHETCVGLRQPVSMDFESDEEVSGLTGGLISGISYLGSAVGAVVLSYIINDVGHYEWVFSLGTIAAIAAVLFAFYAFNTFLALRNKNPEILPFVEKFNRDRETLAGHPPHQSYPSSSTASSQQQQVEATSPT